MPCIHRQRTNLGQIGPDDRHPHARQHLSLLFINGEIAQRLVELRQALEEHLSQLGVAVDDLRDARDVVNGRGTNHGRFWSFLSVQ